MKKTTFLVVITSVLLLGVGASAQSSTRAFSADVQSLFGAGAFDDDFYSVHQRAETNGTPPLFT